MGKEKIGPFIAQLRRERQMTQKELARRVCVTDKAVSKWERCVACPDITLLPEIAAVLGVTTAELLNGTRESPSVTTDGDREQNAGIKRVRRSLRVICSVIFTVILLIGAAVCIICDLAITGTMTWSFFPVVCCAFAGVVCIWPIRYGVRGIRRALIALSAAILPFLFVLDRLTAPRILPVGVPMALIGVAFVWYCYLVTVWQRKRKMRAAALIFAGAIAAQLVIVWILSYLIGDHFDLWDMLSIAVMAAGGGICLLIDAARY